MFGISFLNPLFWIASISCLVPVIFHLTFFQKAKNVKFSTVRFLKENLEKAERKMRLEQILLLLLRMLLILTLVLALTKPVARFLSVTPKALPARKAVIILDDSYSMSFEKNGTSYFDYAKRYASMAIEGLSGEDLFLLIAGSSGNEFIIKNEFSRKPKAPIKDIIKDISSSYKKTDISGAVLKGLGLLDEASKEAKEIYIITDMQKAGWQKENFTRKDVSFFIIDVSKNGEENSAILSAKSDPVNFLQNFQVNIQTILYRKGNKAPAILKILADKKEILARNLELGADETREYSFGAYLGKAGTNACSVEIAPDALRADDRYFFLCKNIGDIKILCIDDRYAENSPGQDVIFLRHLVKSLTPSNGHALSIVHTEDILNLNINNFTFVIVNNLSSSNDAAIEKIKNYIKEGGSVLFFLPLDIDKKFYNEKLSNSNGGPLGIRLIEAVGSAGSKLIYYGVAKVDYQNKILKAFKDRTSGALHQMKVYSLFDVEKSEDTNTLIGLEGGYALLTENMYGKGVVYAITTSLDRNQSDFAINPAFVPLIYRIAVSAPKGHLEPERNYLVGNDLTFPRMGASSNKANLILPSGEEAEIPVPQEGRIVIPDRLVNEPGLYKLRINDLEIDFAVNLDTSESVLDKISREEISSLFPQGSSVEFFRGDESLALFTNQASGPKIWPKILLFGLLCLLLEGFYSNRINVRH